MALNGLYPIIIFNFDQTLANLIGPDKVARIPFVSEANVTKIKLPPIPIYLDENFTGLMIDTEDQTIDIATTDLTLTDATAPETVQKGNGNSITVNMQGKKDSVGLILLCALMSQVYKKVSAKDYSITYLHGTTTIFNGELRNFTTQANTNNDLVNIKFDISKGEEKPVKAGGVTALEKQTDIIPIDAPAPAAGAVSGGSFVPKPPPPVVIGGPT